MKLTTILFASIFALAAAPAFATGGNSCNTPNPPFFCGPQGEPGPTGPQGPQGEQGPAGPQGPQGPKGHNGHDGQDGAPGADGAQGEQGPQGPQGPKGHDGADGQDGRDGVDGTNGTNGTDGRDGVDGTNGTNGTDGRDGVDGVDGTNGADGAQGPAGRDADPLAFQSALDALNSQMAADRGLSALQTRTPTAGQWTGSLGLSGTLDGADAVAAGVRYGLSDRADVYAVVSQSFEGDTAWGIGATFILGGGQPRYAAAPIVADTYANALVGK